ncbi:MAG: hypothetical protein J1F31_01805 [Erysipelotrichales bacterium]|nr:hypothetical protein [Erysipelotrichales bacterium]
MASIKESFNEVSNLIVNQKENLKSYKNIVDVMVSKGIIAQNHDNTVEPIRKKCIEANRIIQDAYIDLSMFFDEMNELEYKEFLELQQQAQKLSLELEVIEKQFSDFSNKAWRSLFLKNHEETQAVIRDHQNKIEKHDTSFLAIVSLFITLVSIVFANIIQLGKDSNTIIITNLSILLAMSVLFFMIKNVHGISFMKFFCDPMNWIILLMIIGFAAAIILLAKKFPNELNESNNLISPSLPATSLDGCS